MNDLSILYSDKFDEKNEHLMFFNPSCFLFPKENNCLPGDTFKKSQIETLINFTKYRKITFKQNTIQIIANYVSIFVIIFSLLFLIFNFSMFIYNLVKKN